MRKKLATVLLLSVAFLPWVLLSPADAGNVLDTDRGIHTIQSGPAGTLTDAELETITAGESLTCVPDSRPEECPLKGPGRFTDIIFWDEWSTRGSRQASAASSGGTAQGNTTGTIQINSFVGRQP